MIVTLGNLGNVGVVKDLAPWELPDSAFSDVGNVRTLNGYAQKIAGHAQVFGTPTITPYGLQPLTAGTKRYWIYPGLTKIYVTDGTTETNITRSAGGDYTGTPDDRWTTDVFAGIAVLNNGKDLPQFWAGAPATRCAMLTAWDTGWRTKSIRAYKRFLVAVNMTESGTNYPHNLRWSDIAAPGALPSAWIASTTNKAGQVSLTDTPGVLVDAMPLGDSLIIYKEDAYYLMQFIGGNDVFRFTPISYEYGALTQNCIANIPGGHVVLGNGEVFRHSGGAPTPLAQGRVRDYIFNTIDAANYKRAFVTTNPRTSEVLICYPTTGSSACDRAVVWNWRSDTFTVREIPNLWGANVGPVDYSIAQSWGSDTESWGSDGTLWGQTPYTQAENRLLFAPNQAKIFIEGLTFTFDTVGFTSYVERSGLAFGEFNRKKLVRFLRPKIECASGTVFTIRLGSQQEANDPISWSAPITFTAGTSIKADGFALGRFLAYRIESAENRPWRLRSLDMDIEMAGLY